MGGGDDGSYGRMECVTCTAPLVMCCLFQAQ